jgi:hypothetical protein
MEAKIQMSDQRPQRETMSIQEATISNMQQGVAVVEVLEQFGGIKEMGRQLAPKTAH